MKIAVISDIHENSHNLFLFLNEVGKHSPGKIIFLGDFINAGIAKILAKSDIPVFAIWGNNDGDKVTITKVSMSKDSNLEVSSETFDFLEINNRRIFLTHYPTLAKPMAKSGDFDAVFYGHNHLQNIDQVGDCLVLNPGEISAHKTSQATYAIYDTTTNAAEIFELQGAVTIRTEESIEHRGKIGLKLNKSGSHKY